MNLKRPCTVDQIEIVCERDRSHGDEDNGYSTSSRFSSGCFDILGEDSHYATACRMKKSSI
jgi:hypothetical protein